MASSQKRVHLSLEAKVKVIKKGDSKATVRSLAEMFGCGKTQVHVSDILKNKEEILCAYESNTCTSKKSKMS